MALHRAQLLVFTARRAARVRRAHSGTAWGLGGSLALTLLLIAVGLSACGSRRDATTVAPPSPGAQGEPRALAVDIAAAEAQAPGTGHCIDRERPALQLTLPPHIAAIWEPEISTLACFAGDELLRCSYEVDAAQVAIRGERVADIDRLVILDGRHARWAYGDNERGFAWQRSGYSIVGQRLPRDIFIDMLGPADEQGQAAWGALYPRLGGRWYDTEERFVIGVPGPGRWTAIMVQGGSRELVTCEAVRDIALPTEPPQGERVAFTCELRFDLSLLRPDRRPVDAVVVGSDRGWSGSRHLRTSPDGTSATVDLTPTDSASSLHFWAPGWEVMRVDGRELETPDTVLERQVKPGRSFRVMVSDEAGEPLHGATVLLPDGAGGRRPAAWSQESDPWRDHLFLWGKTAKDGSVTVKGVPPHRALTIRASKQGMAPVTRLVSWDGGVASFELVLAAP